MLDYQISVEGCSRAHKQKKSAAERRRQTIPSVFITYLVLLDF